MARRKQTSTSGAAPSGVAIDGLFSAAGVQPGDSAEWSISGWPMVVGKIKTPVTVKGIHVKNGIPAIEVIDSTGHGFRAYPGELQKAENHPCKQTP